MVGCRSINRSLKPSTTALRAVTPTFLDGVGRALCRSGESLHVIDVRNGLLTLTPSASWSVHGSDDPASWRYRVTMSGPTATRTTTVRSVQRRSRAVRASSRYTLARQIASSIGVCVRQGGCAHGNRDSR